MAMQPRHTATLLPRPQVINYSAEGQKLCRGTRLMKKKRSSCKEMARNPQLCATEQYLQTDFTNERSATPAKNTALLSDVSVWLQGLVTGLYTVTRCYGATNTRLRAAYKQNTRSLHTLPSEIGPLVHLNIQADPSPWRRHSSVAQHLLEVWQAECSCQQSTEPCSSSLPTPEYIHASGMLLSHHALI